MSFRLDMLVIILSSCGRRGADEMSAIVETIEQSYASTVAAVHSPASRSLVRLFKAVL